MSQYVEVDGRFSDSLMIRGPIRTVAELGGTTCNNPLVPATVVA
jgi:hypothetical protein